MNSHNREPRLHPSRWRIRYRAGWTATWRELPGSYDSKAEAIDAAYWDIPDLMDSGGANGIRIEAFTKNPQDPQVIDLV